MVNSKTFGYIQRNKENLHYELGYSTQHRSGKFNANKAILYYGDERFATEAWDPKSFWSICFDNPAYIQYYKFQEPNYGVGSEAAHQKHWIFYGSNNDNEWIILDEKENMTEHNAPNYLGIYKVRKAGAFKCFKIFAKESWASDYNPCLTFRNFDIFQTSPFFVSRQNYFQYSMIKLLVSILVCK